MDTLSYKTKSANKGTVTKQWFIIDANDAVLGRLASKAAFVLRGKHKTDYTPHVDCGDNIIIINAEKVRLTGKKMTDKVYVRHTGFPGGQRFATPIELLAKKPESIIEKAVKGMLPKTKLGDAIYCNLHVFVGSEHPHEAQKPQLLNLNDIK
jgi:large subunit ribosomal protein L13